jgi:hypothetical protein
MTCSPIWNRGSYSLSERYRAARWGSGAQISVGPEYCAEDALGGDRVALSELPIRGDHATEIVGPRPILPGVEE